MQTSITKNVVNKNAFYKITCAILSKDYSVLHTQHISKREERQCTRMFVQIRSNKGFLSQKMYPYLFSTGGIQIY